MLIFDYNYEYAKYFSVCLKNEQNIICELLLANEKSWIDYEIPLNMRDVDFSKKLNDLTENFVNATLFGYSYSIHFSNEYSNHILIFSTNNHEITIDSDFLLERMNLWRKTIVWIRRVLLRVAIRV